MLILFIVMWNVEPVNQWFWGAVFDAMSVLGVSPLLALEGAQQFKFWDQRGF